MSRAPRVRVNLHGRCRLASAAEIRAVVSAAWRTYGGPMGAVIEVVLLDTLEHTALHERFLGDGTETDVIAFPYGEADCYGEIFVNRDRAELEGTRRGETRRELLLYVLHGALHLLGFDDTTEDAREDMRQAESRILAM